MIYTNTASVELLAIDRDRPGSSATLIIGAIEQALYQHCLWRVQQDRRFERKRRAGIARSGAQQPVFQ
jgi:hypothetical protein